MKKSAFTLLFILALLLCLVPAKTAADTSGQCGPDLNWSFDEASGTFTVTGAGAMYDYNYYGDGNDDTPWASFKGQITRLILPKSLTYIGRSAFQGCTGLTTLTIPEGISSIGNGAFSDCSQLVDITLPSTVTDIYTASFYETAFWNNQPDGLIYLDHILLGVKTKYDYPDHTLSVASGTRVIARDAFSFHSSIQTLILPEGFTHICADAFSMCANIASISLPSTIRSIGDSAFYRGVNTQKCHIYYNGTKAMQQEIVVEPNNTIFASAIWHYASIPVDAETFPDDVFRNWVLTHLPVSGSEAAGYTMTAAQIANVTAIDCSDLGIKDLTGVTEFTALVSLDCSGNALTFLRLNNDLLRTLCCSNNPLSELMIDYCSQLEVLDCSNANLSTVELRYQLKLRELICHHNSNLSGVCTLPVTMERIDCSHTNMQVIGVEEGSALVSLDCSNAFVHTLLLYAQPHLTTLNCANCAFSKLDVSEFPALTTLNCSNNALGTLDVSHNPNLQNLTCGGQRPEGQRITHGKQGYLFNLAAMAGDPTRVTMVTPNANYTSATGRLQFNAKPDSIQYLLAVGGQQMDVSFPISEVEERYLEIDEENFPDEAFRKYVGEYQSTSGDDVIGRYMSAHQATAVTTVSCPGLGIGSVKGIEHFTGLQELDVGYAEENETVSTNRISSLDLSANTGLRKLNCSANPMTSLAIPQSLQSLNCSYCPITALSLGGLNTLVSLQCSGCELTSLNVSGLPNLAALDCSYNRLSNLDLGGNKALQVLLCDGNQLSQLNVSKNTKLYQLSCGDNGLTKLDISALSELEYLDCSENKIAALAVSSAKSLQYLLCGGNQLTSISVNKNASLSYLFVNDNRLTSLDVSQNDELTRLVCDNNQIKTLTLPKNSKLTILSCHSNQLTKLDLAAAPRLTGLYCSDNPLKTLDLSQLERLSELSCGNIGLTTLKLPDAPLLALDCSNNQLGTLDLSEHHTLQKLFCQGNMLTTLNVQHIRSLLMLDCSGNRLTALDVSKNTDLQSLKCSNNRLATLDLSANVALRETELSQKLQGRLEATANGEYQFDLSKLVPLGNMGKVTVSGDAKLNKDTGMVTFSKQIDSFTYQYDTGHDAMAVTIVFNNGEAEPTPEPTATPTPTPTSTPTPAPNAPTIAQQPKDAKVKSGSKAKFTVKVKEKNVTYQWYSKAPKGDWTLMKGETQNKLTVTASGANNGYQYRCLVRNKAGGEAYSNAAKLTVTLQPPVIKTQPKDVAAKSGAKAKFSVKASGKNISYQWYERTDSKSEWKLMKGETKNTLQVVASKATDGHQYYCHLKNADGEADSKTAKLTVKTEAPTIKTQPKNQNVKGGAKAKFSVKAGGKNLKYQWYERANAKGEWTPIKGETRNKLTVETSKAKNGYQYYCKVTNPDGTVDSTVATLTVTPEAPVIKTQPKDVKVKAGAKAKFKVKASPKNVTYQWYYRENENAEWKLIKGATKAEYSFVASAEMFGWQFRCLARNDDGQAWSKVATLLQK